MYTQVHMLQYWNLVLYIVASEHYVYILHYSKTALIQAAWDQGMPIIWKMPETCILCIIVYPTFVHEVRPLSFNFLFVALQMI